METRIAVAQWLAAVGERYSQAYLSHLDAQRLRSDRYYGLRAFLFTWAFERAGAPGGFRIAAVKAVSLIEEQQGDLECLSQSFSALFSGKPNARNNPVLDPRIAQCNVPSIMALVEQGRVREAFSSISLHGIGHKIKAFFLRDLVTITESEAKMTAGPESYLYCQPIDVWVRAVVGALCLQDVPIPDGFQIALSRADINASLRLTDLAQQAHVSPLRVNQGIWYFCSNAVADMGRLRALFKNPDVAQLDGELRLMVGFLPTHPGWG